MNRQYKSITIRGIASGNVWKIPLDGRGATICNRLGHIRNRSTKGEADINDFIRANGGAFLEVEI
jgi:hypothetical protein